MGKICGKYFYIFSFLGFYLRKIAKKEGKNVFLMNIILVYVNNILKIKQLEGGAHT